MNYARRMGYNFLTEHQIFADPHQRAQARPSRPAKRGAKTTPKGTP